MNRIKTLTLLGAIFAVTIGALGYTGISATPLLVSSVQSTSDNIKALGHVEYTVHDAAGAVKAYYQSDNLVVNVGDNCAADRLFAPGSSGICTSFGANGFQYIAIGNATATFDDTNTSLGAAATTTTDGEQARRRDNTPTFTASSTNSTSGSQIIVETPTPFTFSASNATTVRNAALFDAAASAVDANGQTTTVGTSNMFSVQNLSPAVTVSNGDTLNVRWTITIGGNDSPS
jgi:hypothetical protein